MGLIREFPGSKGLSNGFDEHVRDSAADEFEH